MKRLLLLLIGLLFITACSGSGNDPATAVKDYLSAKVAGDTDQIRALLCSEMESVLERETRTFDSVTGVEIEDMSCSQEGDSPVVRCEGQIVALYGAEETHFPLVSYRVIEEDGQWKWCGEAP
jgi:hypothetical protein